MMIPRETDLNKQEEITSSDFATNVKLPSNSTSPSTASWSRLKDPRIVRVSKAYGGKDRHSKVCTVRGLRDRRVRLSVPTAIQLYDLQDRLGLNQPSKVVDWLLNAAKHEIDELPPLDIPPGSFQAMAERHRLKISGSSSSTDHPLEQQPKLGFLGGKLSREVSGETSGDGEETNWGRNDGEDEGRFDLEMSENSLSSRQNLSGLLNSSPIPYNSTFSRWYPSSLTLSHPPRSNGLNEDWHHNFGLLPMSAAAASSGSHHQQQVLVYHPGNTGLSTQPYFHPQNSQMNFQTSNLLPSQNNINTRDDRNKGSM